MAVWTDEQTATLKAGWIAGLSASQIAARLGGTTRNAVIGKVHRLGLSGRAPCSGRVKRHRPRKIQLRAKSPPRSMPTSLPTAPVPPPHVDDIGRVTFQQLDELIPGLPGPHCRWPCGEPTAGFCGLPQVPGLSYCEGHAARACTVSRQVSQEVRLLRAEQVRVNFQRYKSRRHVAMATLRTLEEA
jgi:GcrA cell cycle regulator